MIPIGDGRWSTTGRPLRVKQDQSTRVWFLAFQASFAPHQEFVVLFDEPAQALAGIGSMPEALQREFWLEFRQFQNGSWTCTCVGAVPPKLCESL